MPFLIHLVSLPLGFEAATKMPTVKVAVDAPNPIHEKGILANPINNSVVIRVPKVMVQPMAGMSFRLRYLLRAIDHTTRMIWFTGLRVEVSPP